MIRWMTRLRTSPICFDTISCSPTARQTQTRSRRDANSWPTKKLSRERVFLAACYWSSSVERVASEARLTVTLDTLKGARFMAGCVVCVCCPLLSMNLEHNGYPGGSLLSWVHTETELVQEELPVLAKSEYLCIDRLTSYQSVRGCDSLICRRAIPLRRAVYDCVMT